MRINNRNNIPNKQKQRLPIFRWYSQIFLSTILLFTVLFLCCGNLFSSSQSLTISRKQRVARPTACSVQDFLHVRDGMVPRSDDAGSGL